MDELVHLSIEQGCATITLRRTDARNALSFELIHALASTIAQVSARITSAPHEVRVVVIAGEGKSFCAGVDLKAVLHDALRMGGMLQQLSMALLALRQLPVPTIARVQGAAIGGGCGLVVVCDFAVTHPEAKLGYPEVDLGVCPAVVAPWLVKKIGAGPARAMLLAGGTMRGDEAFNRGLVTHCVARDQLESTTAELVARLMTGGPHALACTKRMLNELDGSNDARIAREAAELSAKVIAGPEAQAHLSRHFQAISTPPTATR
ncbi:MAG: enoyl-CoA hydratase/isomerase family protein [Phycisphaerales bacterium]|nr:enoyl-CoA hydratase/isomerase family protein [Phycisphaerales bacterium]